MQDAQKQSLALGVCAMVSLLVLAYSLVVVQQILLGVLVVGGVWLVYLFWRFVDVLARIAAALEAKGEE